VEVVGNCFLSCDIQNELRECIFHEDQTKKENTGRELSRTLKEKNRFWVDFGEGVLIFLSALNEMFKTTQLWDILLMKDWLFKGTITESPSAMLL
jgi:hypothetical protein